MNQIIQGIKHQFRSGQQLEAISKYSAEDQEWITHKTAELVYGI